MTSDALLLRGGEVYDGTGAAPFTADVLVRDGRIAAVGPDLAAEGARVLDASGLAISPGFIDTHRHIDAAALREPGYGEVELRQGITTAIGGNCGFALFPFLGEHADSLRAFLRPVVGPLDGAALFPSLSAYADAIDAARPALNIGMMAGNGALRIALNGFAPGALSGEQMRRAESLISSALDEGAFGLSMGLMYAPENDYDAPALARLARAMGGRGVLAVHVRGEGRSLADSVREAIAIAREAGVPLQISHFKACGPRAWGAIWAEAKQLIESARAEGLDVRADTYPYDAGSTSLVSLLPPSWQAGGIGALCDRLGDEAQVAALQSILESEQPDYDNLICDIGFESISIASVHCDADERYVGRDLRSAAANDGTSEAALIARLIRNSRGDVAMINRIVSEPNLRDALTLPHSIFISDSILSGGKPHPRCRGAFPKILRLVREQRLMPLEEAVRRMTDAPAQRYAISDRGRIAPGYIADLAVFDPLTVTDTATYERSELMPTGFAYVISGGQIAVEHDRYTGARPGRFIRPRQQ